MRMRPILITAMVASVAAAGSAVAAPDFTPTDIRGKRVGNTVLWAHVFHRARPEPVTFSCTDTNASVALPDSFTEPNTGGITFRPSPDLPAGWRTAVTESFDTWNDAAKQTAFTDFGSDAASTMARPSNRADGVNYMGMASLGGRTLAVTYTWSVAGAVVETDVFFSSKVAWTAGGPTVEVCPSGTAYDVEAIATHELGHSLGFDHIAGVPAATMYATAPAGETRKRTLTSGEVTAVADAFGS